MNLSDFAIPGKASPRDLGLPKDWRLRSPRTQNYGQVRVCKISGGSNC